MEENKLNNDELKQVAGGTSSNQPGDPAHITKTTSYYADKNMNRELGVFQEDTLVWMLSFGGGSCGNVFLVRSRTGNKEGYVPDGTVREDED